MHENLWGAYAVHTHKNLYTTETNGSSNVGTRLPTPLDHYSSERNQDIVHPCSTHIRKYWIHREPNSCNFQSLNSTSPTNSPTLTLFVFSVNSFASQTCFNSYFSAFYSDFLTFNYHHAKPRGFGHFFLFFIILEL